MKRILIGDTAICSSNHGDDVILSAVYDNMGEIFRDGFSMTIGTHVKNFTIPQLLQKGFKVDFCLKADYKFICGTNLLSQHMFGKINSQWQIGPINKRLYKDCVLIGAGATDSSERFDWYARWLLKSTLSHDYQHSVRDEHTKRLLESIGFDAINTGCPTIWKLTPEFCTSIPKEKADNCVITVSGYNVLRDPENDKLMIEIVKRFYKQVYLFVQTTEDEEYFNTIEKSDAIKKIYSLYELRELYAKKNIDYIGSRLHGGVFSLQNSVRSLVICVDNRARGFRDCNNLPAIERKETKNELEKWIFGCGPTKMIIDQQAINKFKSQF